MSERVWVVVDVEGGSPYLGTVRPTRAAAIRAYDATRAFAMTYSGERKNGWVRCQTATLTLEQPKSKRKS